MKTVFKLALKAASRDPFLLFWSILLPVGGMIGLGIFIKIPGYPSRILTGMMAASVLFYALVTSAFSILGRRRRGVYNLLQVTPMKLWQYVFSLSGAWTLVCFLCAALILAFGMVVFSIKISLLSVIMLIPLIAIATIGYIFFSFFIASLSRTEGHVSMISNIVMLPLMFISDSFYSLEDAPSVLKILSRFNPFQWFTNGIAGSLNANISGWLFSLVLLAITAVAGLFLAVKTFRYSQ